MCSCQNFRCFMFSYPVFLDMFLNSGYLHSTFEGYCSGKNEWLEKASCLSAWEGDGDNLFISCLYMCYIYFAGVCSCMRPTVHIHINMAIGIKMMFLSGWNDWRLYSRFDGPFVSRYHYIYSWEVGWYQSQLA